MGNALNRYYAVTKHSVAKDGLGDGQKWRNGQASTCRESKGGGIFPRHPALTPDHTYGTQTLSMQSGVLEADGKTETRVLLEDARLKGTTFTAGPLKKNEEPGEHG